MRRPSPITMVLVTTALAAAINLVTSTVQVEKPWWPPLVATLTVLLVVAAIIVEWYERRSQTGRADELERVADWLAGKVRNQWEHEAVLRRLHDPMPLQVHWRSTHRPVAADRAVVLDDQAGADWEMLPLRGHAEEIVRAFLDLPHGRLVVLGEPGAGKSVLAILLTLGLLQHRQTLPPEERDRAPVPVLVPIASWNPEAEHLKAFLARRLGEEYPRLHQIGEDGISPAAALIADRLVLPILDGLDELPASQHASAVGELNDYAGAGPGLVVTCRSREYEQAITTLGAELARAAVVELQAVTAEQVIAFLSHPAVARPRWQPVFDHLRASPDGVLAKVLSTPLMASLARAAYTSLLTDPGELLRMTRASDIRARLIDGFVTDAYLSDRPAPPGVRALRRYPSARAGRWLSCLAFQLAEAGRVDWWWWQLPAGLLVVRRRREKVMIAVGAVTAAAGLALTAGPLIAAAVTGLVAVNALGLWQPLWPEGYPPFFRSIARRRLVLLRMAFAATGPVLTGLVLSAPLFGSTLGLISAVAAAMLPIRQGGHTVRGSWPAGTWIGRWRMGRMRPMSRRTGPDATLRANHRAAADTAIWHAALGASIVGLAAAVVPGSPDVAAAALAGGLVYGGNAGLAAGWRTWIRYRLIHLSLAARDLLPWRLWRFLHDAHLRGVLRQAGTSWQFRHVLLQTRLASPTRTDHLRARADAGDTWAAERLAELLAQQGQMEELRARADAGDEWAARRLVDLLAQQGRVEEALALLRARADAGNESAAIRLAELLAQQGRVEEALALLRARADAGNESAAIRLAELLAQQGQMEELRARADAGDTWAAERLAELLAQQGQMEELRARADAGDEWAARRLVDLLAQQGRVEEALALLRAHADAGNWRSAIRLAELLAQQGQMEELRARADAGDASAAERLADLLAQQGRVEEALALLRAHADAGKWGSARQLAELLAQQGRVEEALALLRAHADAGDESAAERLAELLAQQGQMEELRARADAGDASAAERLADLLAQQGRVEEALALLRAHADAGKWGSARRLAELLAQQGQMEELRARADAGDESAAERLADLLAQQGRVEEAIALLRAHADAGKWGSARRLAELLAQQGQMEELRARADAGDESAAERLADLLAQQGRVEEAIALLRAHADAGKWGSARQLAELLAQQGQMEELRARADAGDESAAERLADLLAQQGRVEEAIALLRAHADAGNWGSAIRLADLLAQQGQMEELRARADAGDESAAERLADLHAQRLEGE